MSQTLENRNKSPISRLDYLIRKSHPGKPVLVALDGGPVAERALPAAAMLARQWNAPLRLVQIRNPVQQAQHVDARLADNSPSLSLRSGAYLSKLADSLRRDHGVYVERQAAVGTCVESSLRSLCEEDARMLVMVRTKRPLVSRFWWGSVTDGLIGRLPVPLLLVPEQAPRNECGLDADGFARLLIHFETLEATGASLDQVAAIGAPDALCHLLRVLPLSNVYAAGRRGLAGAFPQRDQAWRELFRAKERLEAQGLSGEPKLIFDGQTAAAAIVEQARALQAQVIVVAGRNHLLPWWLRDGVAEYVVHHTHLPVLIVPANGSLGNSNTQQEKHHVGIRANEGLPSDSADAATNRSERSEGAAA